MKKLISILSLTVFLGAGCVSVQRTSLPVGEEQEPTEISDKNEMEGTTTEDTIAEKKEEDPDEEMMEETQKEMGDVNIEMQSGNFFFKPSVIEAKPGQTVNATITGNEGFHTLVIDAISLKQTVKSGETISFVAPTTPGNYEFYCDVGSHRAMGMKGTLTVVE
jgi:plastocyanin